ncbi:MAG: hypothetical protein ABIQ93_01320 [Saprospiraceae bacterium]
MRGFHFFNTCSPSVFGGNIMGHHQRSTISSTGATAGLLMEAQSVIGPQFCRHNKFTLPTYTPDDGAWHKGSFADFIASRFDYNPTITQETPVPVSPSSGWFLINTSDPLCTDSTSGYHCGESGHGYKDFLGEDELALIEENQMLYDPSSEAYAWEARRNLLAKLLRYPGLKSLYPAAQVFFDQQIGSSAGQFAQWNKQIDQAMLIEPNQLETLQQNRSQVSSLTEELDQLDATLTTPEAVTNADSSFFAARAVLLGQIKSLAVEESALTAAIELLRTPALASIAETLETLPHTAPYEQNQVFLNSLAVKKARAEAFSEEDYDLLRTIAAQCPDIVGTTRDRAMDYLPVGDPARIIRETRDEPNCLEERKIQSERVETASTELTLSPNPVESTLSVDFRSPFSGKIQVFALTGRTALWSADIQFEKYITIPAQQLGSGAYILMATDISGHRTVQKFAVSRK